MKKVIIFTADSNGGFPVPAVKGGAVSTLIEALASGNEKENLLDMTIVSFYDERAEKIAKGRYPHIHFVWITPPSIVKLFDGILFGLIRFLFKKKKAISYRSVFSLLWYISVSSNYLRHNDFDKVVLENNILIAKIIRKSGYSGEYYFHLHNVPRINGREQRVFENCTAFLCVSRYVGSEIEKKSNAIGPIPSEKVRILYNCIDTDHFSPLQDKELKNIKIAIKEKYNIPLDKKIVLFTGRLSEEKGVDKLLEAIGNIDCVTVIVCGGLLSGLNLKDTYQEKVHQLAEKLGDKVIFTGYIDQNVLPQYYNAADVAVLPSMWDEPAGLTMIEALSCGTPVITTKSGGIPEYVGDVATILQRDTKLTSDICEAIRQVINSENDDKCISRNKRRERIVQRFGKELYIYKFKREINC